MMNKSIIVKPIFNLLTIFTPQTTKKVATGVSNPTDDRELLSMLNQQTRINNLRYNWQYNLEGKVQGTWLNFNEQ